IVNFNTNDTRAYDSATTISGSGTAQWNSGTNTFNGTISSNVTLNSGTLNLNNASTQSIPALNMQGGTLAGNAPVTLTGAAQTWTGGTIAGTGLLTIPNTTIVTFNGYVSFDSRSISNAGTMNYTSNYYSYVYNGATLTNGGTIDFQGDGGFYPSTGSGGVSNNGTIKKSAGTGQGSIQIPLTANSGSQVQVQSGSLLFGNVTSTGGTINVSSGAIALFYYTTTSTFDAASSFTGAGTVTFQAGTNTISGNYNITGATKSTGGTTSIGSNITNLGDVTV